jgi:3-hydroxyacyl-CoA dehydrogenase
VVYVTGYGFPAQRGGPMYYADQIGLANVYRDIQRLHEEYGYWWKPAPLLEKLAAENGRFGDL